MRHTRNSPEAIESFGQLTADLSLHEAVVASLLRPGEQLVGVGRTVQLAEGPVGMYVRGKASDGGSIREPDSVTVDFLVGNESLAASLCAYYNWQGAITANKITHDRISVVTAARMIAGLTIEREPALRAHIEDAPSDAELEFLDTFARDQENDTAVFHFTYGLGGMATGMSVRYIPQPLSSI